MMNHKSTAAFSVINLLILFIITLFHTTGCISIKIFSATPLITLSALVAVCMFVSELPAFFIGLLIGIATDTVASGSSFIYALEFSFLALFVSITVKFFFNNNIRSALAICFICSAVSFLLKWIIFYVIGGMAENNIVYLIKFALPSIIYTTLCVIPFYYIERLMFKKLIN